jgi:UPF0716 family protein affecting phage T7 exclusion
MEPATMDTLAMIALVVIPGLMTLAIGLMVIWLLERRAHRKMIKRTIPLEAEKTYIRKCFPDKPSDVLGDATLNESSAKSTTVRPIQVKVRFTREEWALPPSDLLTPKADWN